MPAGGFTIGRDVAVDMGDPTRGGMLNFPAITGFTKKSGEKRISSNPLNGKPMHVVVPHDGWSGTMTFDRKDSSIDDFFARIEEIYWSGGSLPFSTITETITEADGVSQYLYDNVTFMFDNPGDWKAGEKVTLTISWAASSRRKII